MIDGFAGRSTSYEYDLAGRNVASTVTDTTEYDLVASGTTSYADGTGLVDKQTTTIYGANNTVAKHLTYSYGYGTPTSSAGPEAISGLAVNGEQYLYSYDTLGRLITRKTSIGAENESLSIYQQTNTGKREEYTYVNNSDGTTTTLVKSFRDMLGVLHTYEYDGNGNITSETIGDVNSPNAVKTYKYDEQNRLTRYNDSELNTTIIYTYDSRGNITNYTLYEYAADESDVDESTADSYGFAYNNSTWKDLATSIFDEAISYDTIGNPLNWYTGATFTWENGRQLKSVNKNGSGTTYMYNGDGLRTEKWGNRTTQYIILDGTYLGEKTTFYGGTTYLITYIYGAEGSVIGLDVNGTAYYFVKNLQGDVTSIIDINGNILANYSYDAYGYCMSITDGNGNAVTSDTHIANLNPFRYRGYFYDQETGFYYLRSRYYDPAVCRFLNADGMVSTGQGFDGNNMFAYCNSNPVSFYDPDGDSFIALALAGAAINLATSYLGALITGQEYTWADAGIDVASGFISAIPIVGPWFGAAISGIWTGISTFNNGSSIGGAIFSGVADAVLTMGSIGNLANFCGNSVDLVTTIALDSTFGAANSFISSVVSVSAVEMSNNKTANTPTITNTAYSAFETIKRKQSMSKVRIVDGRKIIVDSKMSYVDEREYNRLYCYVEFYGG